MLKQTKITVLVGYILTIMFFLTASTYRQNITKNSLLPVSATNVVATSTSISSTHVISSTQISLAHVVSTTSVVIPTSVFVETSKITTTRVIKTKPIATQNPVQTQKFSRSVTTNPIKAIPKDSSSKIYKVTAYDLSVESCGKARTSKYFGITRSGFSLVGHTWQSARTIAADLSLLPMGSKVNIEFINSHYYKYNGIYTVRDTGSAIHGYILDFFIGDDAHQEAINFGVTKAYVTKIN